MLRDSPGEAVDPDSVFGLRLFGVHLDAELFIQQQDKGDGPRVGLHVQQARVLHHQPATQTQTQTHAELISGTSKKPLIAAGSILALLVLEKRMWEELKRGDVGGRSRAFQTCGILFCVVF